MDVEPDTVDTSGKVGVTSGLGTRMTVVAVLLILLILVVCVLFVGLRVVLRVILRVVNIVGDGAQQLELLEA